MIRCFMSSHPLGIIHHSVALCRPNFCAHNCFGPINFRRYKIYFSSYDIEHDLFIFLVLFCPTLFLFHMIFFCSPIIHLLSNYSFLYPQGQLYIGRLEKAERRPSSFWLRKVVISIRTVCRDYPLCSWPL